MLIKISSTLKTKEFEVIQWYVWSEKSQPFHTKGELWKKEGLNVEFLWEKYWPLKIGSRTEVEGDKNGGEIFWNANKAYQIERRRGIEIKTKPSLEGENRKFWERIGRVEGKIK